MALASEEKQDTSNTSLASIDATSAKLTQPSKQTDVTASDSTDLTGLATKGLWVGTGGNLSVKMASDAAAHTLKNVPSGTYVPGNYIRVMAATTAADIVAMS